MTVGRFAKRFTSHTIGALLMMSVASPALAQDNHDHGPAQQQELRPDQKARAGELIKAVRAATEQFKDVEAAKGEQYELKFGCVSGSDYGAMGLHFVKFPLVFDGKIELEKPEIILYEPLPNGKFRITGADYLVLADAWDANHADPPELMGQLFHFFDSPNRFKLPPFYTLHVWAWKENPAGAFTNWNPNVSCEAFVEQ